MKDVIYVEHKNFVSVKDHSICFKNHVKKTAKYIPIDEIQYLVFDNLTSNLTSEVVAVCIQNNIGIIFCGKNHSPIAEVNSQFLHRKRSERVKSQIYLSQRTKNRLWKKIIVAKIRNQSNCLKNEVESHYYAKMLMNISWCVKEGDRDNREAFAAHVYFPALFDKNFKRGRFNDVVNSALNYGYALLRAMIRKELAIVGFEMSLGIFHHSSENPFNLCDDIIESFRPFVDALVYREIYLTDMQSFDRDQRIKMLSIFVEKCIIDDKVYSISDAIRCCVESLISCFEKNHATSIKLPSFLEIVL